MKNKYIMILAPILLLAGAAMIVMHGNARRVEVADSRRKVTSLRTADSGSSQANESGVRANDRARVRVAGAHQELVSRYGESRTNLSKYVANNLVGLMDDAVQMAEMMQSGALGKELGGRGGLAMALGGLENDLKLTDEQKEKAEALLAEREKRRLDDAKTTLARLKQDPTPLMKLMLASDAVSRGEMKEEEYKGLQAESAEALKEVANPLDGGKMRHASPLNDAGFLTDFKAILDPSQNETLQASINAKAANQESNNGSAEGIANLPGMNLEKVDASVESARKITTGLKSMLDGFGGLKKLNPAESSQGGQ